MLLPTDRATVSLFRNDPSAASERSPAVGVLMANLGTPERPTAAALRTYLRQFLWDPRVVEGPRLRWWLVLHLFVLTTRPRHSARLYRKVWTAEGSPLLTLSRGLTEAVSRRLRESFSEPVEVVLGMRYGQPSIPAALRELRRRGCDRLLCLPLFPQYSATTTASVFDAVTDELRSWRFVPELRTVHGYGDDSGYVEALAASIRELWETEGAAERLVLSFHGVPVRYAAGGDPYPDQCERSARLVAESLGLEEGSWMTSFQSQFGREEWIRPATDATMEALGREGIGSVDVVCPGFAVDCLETLEEIAQENRALFLRHGGERFRYVPCLNERPTHVGFLVDLVTRNLQGWGAPDRSR